MKNCEEDDIYKYLFQKRCYEICPNNSLKSENTTIINDYYCKPNCSKDYPFEMVLTQECVKNCPINNKMKDLCILNYQIQEKQENKNEKEIYEEEVEVQDILLENFEVGFTSEDYDTSNLDKGEDEVFENEKMKITLTTTQNQKNITNNNMTVIDLGECENILRIKYNLNEDDILYMKKIDINQEGMKIPKVEYDVYCKLSGNNLIKLNLSFCENTKISLSIPIEITESLDKLNSSSGYYNDICYIATSENGTDISLEDRKKEYINGNKMVCQDDCDFSEYDSNIKKAKCLCKPKESSTSFIDMKINKTRLFESFTDIKNKVNISLMKCYKVLFSKKGIISNISNYIIIFIYCFFAFSDKLRTCFLNFFRYILF